jgi:hypothetical protein
MQADNYVADTQGFQSVRLPPHVVYRAFAKETVILNLQTGKYHGVNPTGGRMLEILTRSDTVGDAVAKLAAEYGQPREQIALDVDEFCRDLLERGLIELETRASG